MTTRFKQSNRIKLGVYVVTACFLFSVSAQANTLLKHSCDIPESWNVMIEEDITNKASKVAIDLNTEEITLNQPFSFQISVCNKHNVKPDRVTVDAIMPAHQHGMNYTPMISLDKESKLFTVEGFLFHMPGLWEITISHYQGENVTHYTKEITIN